MAWKEGTVQPQHFVEEIDYTEIEKLEVCVTATNLRNMYWKFFQTLYRTVVNDFVISFTFPTRCVIVGLVFAF